MVKNVSFQKPPFSFLSCHKHAWKKHLLAPCKTISIRSFVIIAAVVSTCFYNSARAQIINTIAGNGVSTSCTGDGGPATSAATGNNWSVAADGLGNVYIGSDNGSSGCYSRVRRVDAYGTITTFAGTGSPGYSGDGGPASAAQLYYPWGVACDPSNNLYISDEGNARIRKVNTSGIISTICGTGSPGFSGDGGPATAAQVYEPWAITCDPSGNIFFYDWYNYRVRKISTSGTITTVAGTGSPGDAGDGGPATSATLSYIYGLAADGSGNIYLADYNYHRVRVVNLSSGTISAFTGTAGSTTFGGDGGPASAATWCEPIGVSLDGGGNLYISDICNARVRKVNAAGIVSTVAGTGTAGFYGDGGPATAARLTDPFGLATDPAGNLYIADYVNYRVRKITNYNRPCYFTLGASATMSICENSLNDSVNYLLPVFDSDLYQGETWNLCTAPTHGTFTGGYTMVSACDTMHPHGMSYTPNFGYSGPDTFRVSVTDGFIYDTIIIYVTVNPIPSIVTGYQSCAVGSYTTLLDSASGGTWSGSSSMATVTGSSGVVAGLAAGTAMFTYTLPTGCPATATVNIFPYAGRFISTIAGNGTGGFTGDGGNALSAEISSPWGVAADAVGNKYIADYSNNRIRKVSPTGVITTIAGTTAGAGFSGDGTAATLAQLNHPFDVAVDASGNIYIADDGNNRIRKINTSGIITTVAGNGGTSYTGDGLAATAAGINSPSGIAVDGSGNLYIATDGTHVRKVNSSGIVTTFAGNGTTTYGADGTPATANGLNNPVSVAVDVSGNVYIADQLAQRIRKVNTSGIISTIAGSGSSAGFSGDGGPAVSAVLSSPWGLATDPLGNIYIGDHGNNRIRKINTSGTITTIAGGSVGFSGDACMATNGQLNSHWGICTDGSGNVYIADGGNNRVRRVASNHAPVFVGGHTQSTSMCANSTDSLAGFLTIQDIDSAQGETWSGLTSPANGTLSASYSGTSTGGSLAPVGLTYIPTIGFTGSDSFKVVVADCAGGTDTTKIVIVVSPPPSAIVGANSVCPGLTTPYSDPIGTGVWSSNDTTKAKVDAVTGIVSGVATGIAVISYAPGASCSVTKTITVSASPAAITGTTSICHGFTTTLGDVSTGGTWSASSTIVTVGSSSGVVTSASAFGTGLGTAAITYTQGGCPAFTTVTVFASPVSITGIGGLCVGTLTSLYEPGTAGRWSSSNTTDIPVDSLTGIVTGVAPGTGTVSYTLLAGGCSTSFSMAVYPNPDPITGPATMCTGQTDTLSNASGGGFWSTTGLGFSAGVDSVYGAVTGLISGTTTIAYTLFLSGCSSTMDVTVNASPSAISAGTGALCAGSTLPLYDPPGTGTWTSGSAAVATISSTGVVHGLAGGTTTISYSEGGCPATVVVTVHPSPSVPYPTGTGTLQLCTGLSVTLSDSLGGGTWSSSGSASVTPGGIVTAGSTPGTATITYTMSSGCHSAAVVTVNTAPGAISGSPKICLGLATTLTESGTGSGTWTSSFPGVATVAATGGTATVTGMSAGSGSAIDTITYSLGAGCSTKLVVTVSSLPAAIGGTLSVCSGSVTPLGSSPGPGTWSGGLAGTATISAAGVVTGGATSGTAPVTYTQTSTGCPRTAIVTVNPLPSAITGPSGICAGGSTITLSGPPGGAWSSIPASVASAGTTGIITGNAPGTATISYTLPGTGCARSKVITVNPVPSVITGTMQVCTGLTTPLSDSLSGGAWSVSGGYAAINPTSGLVTGIGATGGIAPVAYTFSVTGCQRTAQVTVNPAPVIGGPSAVCVGPTITLSGSGGAWTSSNPGVATINPLSGVVTGIVNGTTIMDYTLPTGCHSTMVVTVSPSPVAVTGAATVCAGAAITLTDTVGGGLWTSSAPAATVGSLSGIVTGITPGSSATITYSLGSGCTVTKTISVLTAPAPLSGTPDMCAGTGVTLTLPSGVGSGGTWSSGSLGVATVNPTGSVHGLAAGAAVISYTPSTGGCPSILAVTVNPVPGPVTGPSAVCVGATIAQADTTAGGTWTAGPGITINSSGVVTGASTGPAAVTYTAGGCMATRTVTVNTIAAITGATGLCMGTTTTLGDPSGGGIWSTAPGGVVTISPSGLVTAGTTTGAATVTYSLGTGCIATTTINVNTAPSGISGSTHVCVGLTTNLSNTAGGGTWTSASPTYATVDPTSGDVTGISPGTSWITYSLGTGCTVNALVTVTASPPAITGTAQVCAGATTPLGDPTTGGTWDISAGPTASVGPTGIVSGLTAGTATVSYTLGGCAAIKEVTVTPAPSIITGTATVCAGQTTILSDSAAGGTWSSGTATAGTVDPTSGTVTGISAGTVPVTYTTGTVTGCRAVRTVTVNNAPAAITGIMSICLGSTTTLSDATPGGTWGIIGTPGITVSPAGVVSGTALGTATVNYALAGAAGCPATATVTVNSLPGAISGALKICLGATDTLSDLPGGGVWTSSNVLVATIIPATGAMTGINPGTATISYSLGVGCTVSKTVTVQPLPAAITGPTEVCAGYHITLSDPAPGGVWSPASGGTGSGTAPVATISPSGVVTGVTSGIATISYLPASSATGCPATYSVAVIKVPAIMGVNNICAYGSTLPVTDSMPGGAWTSTLVGISPAGVVTSYAAGPAMIYYTLSDGCFASAPLTVNPLPAPVGGNPRLCIGLATTLSETSSGGVWTSSDTTIAKATATGAASTVTGIAAGTAAISYTLPTGCGEAMTVTVSPLPSAIGGPANVCAGNTTTLTNTTTGGSWSSSAAAVATIDATSGMATGLMAGTASIIYTLGASCTASKTITVNALPAAYPVTGGGNYCAGGAGVAVGVGNSQAGVSYQLYAGPATAGSAVTGTGAAIGFGPQATAGSYTVIAVNAATGCTEAMTGSVPVVVTPTVTPTLSLAAATGDTICAGSTATFTATATNGGTTPIYAWYVNSAVITGVTGNTYSYTPANGDLVTAMVTSTATCATPDTASHTVQLTADPLLVPVVNIHATPGTNILAGHADTFSVTWTGAGASPGYQWYVDGVAIPGATDASYVGGNLNNGDSVSCVVTSNGPCGGISGNSGEKVHVYSNVGVGTVNVAAGDLTVLPNPSKGTFTVKGTTGNTTDEDITLEVTDLVGQVVYRSPATAKGGRIDTQVQLGSNIANGMYLLNVHTENGNRVFHIVVEQ